MEIVILAVRVWVRAGCFKIDGIVWKYIPVRVYVAGSQSSFKIDGIVWK